MCIILNYIDIKWKDSDRSLAESSCRSNSIESEKSSAHNCDFYHISSDT